MAQRQLKLLAVLHFLAAVVTACLALFGGKYLTLGFAYLHRTEPLPPLPPELEQGFAQVRNDPELIGLTMIFTGALVLSLSLVHSGALAFIGWCIARRRRRMLCVIFSIFDLTYLLPVPIGFCLSLYALWVLTRPAVVELFQPAAAQNRAAKPALVHAESVGGG